MKYIIYFFSCFFLVSEQDIINTRLECPFLFKNSNIGILLNLIEVDSDILGDVNFENINLYFKYNFYEKEFDQFDFYLNVFININCIFEFQVKIVFDFFNIFMCKYLNFSFEFNILESSHSFYFKFLKSDLFKKVKFEFNINLEKICSKNTNYLIVKKIENIESLDIEEQNNLLDENIKNQKEIFKKKEILMKKSNPRRKYILNLDNSLSNCNNNIEYLIKSLMRKKEKSNLKFFLKRIGIENDQIEEILIKNSSNDFKEFYNKIIKKKYYKLSIELHPDKNKEGLYINEMYIDMKELNDVRDAINNILCC